VKLGILGGSFNPVHIGHLFLGDTILSELKLDRVVFIPAYRSPFKLDAKSGRGTESSAYEADDRIAMLAAAICGDSRFTIDDCEIKREGISYTVDTLEDIISRYKPEGKPALIIGDDLVADFPKWRDSDRILQMADVVIARRISSSALDCSFPHKLINNETMTISSQMIRQRISEGSAWRSLVPPGTRAIIEDRKLYGLSSENNSSLSCSQSDIQRIETEALLTLTTERFLHSRCTAIHASDMCRNFGLDPAAGYLAGIAHDLAKQFENKHLIKIVKNAGLGISQLEKDKPNLLHGKAAAVLLRDRFCIHNKDVLEAVASHTSGTENMGPLAKVVYIADKTECLRNIDPVLRKMCAGNTDLDSLLFTVLERTITKLQARKLDLSEDTVLLFNKMKER